MRHKDLPLVVDSMSTCGAGSLQGLDQQDRVHGFGATPAAAPRPGAQLSGPHVRSRGGDRGMDARGIDMSVVSSSTVLQGSPGRAGDRP